MIQRTLDYLLSSQPPTLKELDQKECSICLDPLICMDDKISEFASGAIFGHKKGAAFHLICTPCNNELKRRSDTLCPTCREDLFYTKKEYTLHDEQIKVANTPIPPMPPIPWKEVAAKILSITDVFFGAALGGIGMGLLSVQSKDSSAPKLLASLMFGTGAQSLFLAKQAWKESKRASQEDVLGVSLASVCLVLPLCVGGGLLSSYLKKS